MGPLWKSSGESSKILRLWLRTTRFGRPPTGLVARSWKLSSATSISPSPHPKSGHSLTSMDQGTQMDSDASTTWYRTSSVLCSASSDSTSRSSPSKKKRLGLTGGYVIYVLYIGYTIFPTKADQPSKVLTISGSYGVDHLSRFDKSK